MQAELQEFVKELLRLHISRRRIRQALKNAGWQDDEIAAVLPAPERRLRVSAFVGLSVAVIVASVAGILFMAGPKREQRTGAMDWKRSSNLESIAANVAHFWWMTNEKIIPPGPWTLACVEQSSLQDPETGEPYGYREVSANSIELCATFASDSSGGMPMEPLRVVHPGMTHEHVPNFRRHGAGRQCFIVELGPRPAQ